MTPVFQDRHAVLARLGTFWHQGMAEDVRARTRSLVELAQDTRVLSTLRGAREQLEGRPHRTEDHITLRFQAAAVLQLGADLQTRVTTRFGDGVAAFTLLRRPPEGSLHPESNTNLLTEDGYILTAPDDEYLLFPSSPGAVGELTVADLQLRYLVPCEHGFHAYAIATAERDLVAGLDYLNGDGFLLFKESPVSLFPDGRILVTGGRRRSDSLLNYSLRVDGGASCARIARYYRGSQSAASFQAAIAEAAGLCLLPWTSTLLEIIAGESTRYVFTHGVLDVAYAHAALSVGQTYAEDYVIGEGVQVRACGSSTGDWWRRIDWGAGLSLDGLCPFDGLTLPDRTCRAWATAVSGDSFLIRCTLDGPAATQDAFWAYVNRGAQLTGQLLNAAVGLTTLGAVKFLNPLDLYFTFLLRAKAVVITLNLTADARKKAVDFILREKPLGAIPIIL